MGPINVVRSAITLQPFSLPHPKTLLKLDDDHISKNIFDAINLSRQMYGGSYEDNNARLVKTNNIVPQHSKTISTDNSISVNLRTESASVSRLDKPNIIQARHSANARSSLNDVHLERSEFDTKTKSTNLKQSGEFSSKPRISKQTNIFQNLNNKIDKYPAENFIGNSERSDKKASRRNDIIPYHDMNKDFFHDNGRADKNDWVDLQENNVHPYSTLKSIEKNFNIIPTVNTGREISYSEYKSILRDQKNNGEKSSLNFTHDDKKLNTIFAVFEENGVKNPHANAIESVSGVLNVSDDLEHSSALKISKIIVPSSNMIHQFPKRNYENYLNKKSGSRLSSRTQYSNSSRKMPSKHSDVRNKHFNWRKACEKSQNMRTITCNNWKYSSRNHLRQRPRLYTNQFPVSMHRDRNHRKPNQANRRIQNRVSPSASAAVYPTIRLSSDLVLTIGFAAATIIYIVLALAIQRAG